MSEERICPFVKICNKNVNLEHFQKHCCDNYEECDVFKSKAESKKTPAEWLKIMKGEDFV